MVAKYQDPFGSRIVIDCNNCGLVVNASRFGIRIEKYVSDLPDIESDPPK